MWRYLAPILLLANFSNANKSIDSNGYVMYCPCMGRFGNQADHFLGSFSFSKKLNRTLIVPPWITFNSGGRNGFVPYTKWFKAEPLSSYHRVIMMEDFMKDLSPSVWPEGVKSRKIYCHRFAMDRSEDKSTCPAKFGNPFKPFWDNFNIEFEMSMAFTSGLSYQSTKEQWDEAFPSNENPVIALMGAPASYPIAEADRYLQKYVEWSDEIKAFASDFIEKELKRPYLGIHLRNGMDWKRACRNVKGSIKYPYMSSPQCVGFSQTKPFTHEMCYPQKEAVIEQVTGIIKKSGAKSLFIATDDQSFEKEFKQSFLDNLLDVDMVKLDHDSLVKDMAILMEADEFMGSCASSVTAFVVRKRNILNKPNSFVGMLNDDKPNKTEL
ncbi:GDP-fucose protein O-fucosyltransferase 1-like [Clavelina lepadiformis]|uniref:GDP-fucose protein O-fucosyltransferase 1-like n=1 Tax=Clavelina lepadiformis TaxID=159417 RepID=UPI004041EFF1